MKNEKVWKIAMTGVFAALSYVVFTFLQFKIWLPGGVPPRSISETLSVCSVH